jgi:DNA polymerase-3 subunit epsilon
MFLEIPNDINKVSSMIAERYADMKKDREPHTKIVRDKYTAGHIREWREYTVSLAEYIPELKSREIKIETTIKNDIKERETVQLDNFEIGCLRHMALILPDAEIRIGRGNTDELLIYADYVYAILRLTNIHDRYFISVKESIDRWMGLLLCDSLPEYNRIFLTTPEDLYKLYEMITERYDFVKRGWDTGVLLFGKESANRRLHDWYDHTASFAELIPEPKLQGEAPHTADMPNAALAASLENGLSLEQHLGTEGLLSIEQKGITTRIGFGSSSIEAAPTKREYKGKSLLSCLDEYVALDLETTGLNPHGDAIIELAAVKVRAGKSVDSFQTLVNPRYEIEDFIIKLTGITNEMLVPAPKIEDVMQSFIDFIGDDVVVAHNANFDVNFIYDSSLYILNHLFSNSFIDTMRMSRRLFPELPNHKLSTLLEYFRILSPNTHRALGDTECVIACYEYMKSEIKSLGVDLDKVAKVGWRASDISSIETEYDVTHPLYKKVCVFTGALGMMTRRDAMQMVVDVGGLCADSVTKNTNFLIIGDQARPPDVVFEKSSKQRKAEKLKLANNDIEIIPESVFYDMVLEVR